MLLDIALRSELLSLLFSPFDFYFDDRFNFQFNLLMQIFCRYILWIVYLYLAFRSYTYFSRPSSRPTGFQLWSCYNSTIRLSAVTNFSCFYNSFLRKRSFYSRTFFILAFNLLIVQRSSAGLLIFLLFSINSSIYFYFYFIIFFKVFIYTLVTSDSDYFFLMMLSRSSTRFRVI